VGLPGRWGIHDCRIQYHQGSSWRSALLFLVCAFSALGLPSPTSLRGDDYEQSERKDERPNRGSSFIFQADPPGERKVGFIPSRPKSGTPVSEPRVAFRPDGGNSICLISSPNRRMTLVIILCRCCSSRPFACATQFTTTNKIRDLLRFPDSNKTRCRQPKIVTSSRCNADLHRRPGHCQAAVDQSA
jgi:hypothetical protein